MDAFRYPKTETVKTETVSGTVFHEYFPGTAFISDRGDEAESFDHCGDPLQFAEWLTADHTLPQLPQFPFPFVHIHPTHPVGRSRDGPFADQGLLQGVSVVFRHRLPHRQASARATSPARSALRST